MRALKLMALIWSLAVAGALTDYAMDTGTGLGAVAGNMTSDLQSLNITVGGDYLSWTLNAVTTGFTFLWTMLRYGLLLGSMAQALSPWPLPDVFTTALNGFSLLVNAIGVIQFITGRTMTTME